LDIDDGVGSELWIVHKRVPHAICSCNAPSFAADCPTADALCGAYRTGDDARHCTGRAAHRGPVDTYVGTPPNPIPTGRYDRDRGGNDGNARR
jgi:hypothetical protein